MSTNNVCFRGEMVKKRQFGCLSYLELVMVLLLNILRQVKSF